MSRDAGAKIVSLRAVGVEWLLQPELDRLADTSGDFVSRGLSGWDECIPTVESCVLTDGTPVADHGSVWDRPWNHASDNVANITVNPEGFQFERWLRQDAQGLLVRYSVRNVSHRQINLMWAAHPQLNAPLGTVVQVPADRYLQTFPAVEAMPDASPIGIDDVLPNHARKVYVDKEQHVGSARLLRADGRWLRFAWDSDLVPHLGLWLDAGAYAHRPVIAIEPCIGWYDNLSRAIANETSINLEPGKSRQWWIRITAGRSTPPTQGQTL